jgi:hypothetical protein
MVTTLERAWNVGRDVQQIRWAVECAATNKTQLRVVYVGEEHTLLYDQRPAEILKELWQSKQFFFTVIERGLKADPTGRTHPRRGPDGAIVGPGAGRRMPGSLPIHRVSCRTPGKPLEMSGFHGPANLHPVSNSREYSANYPAFIQSFPRRRPLTLLLRESEFFLVVILTAS